MVESNVKKDIEVYGCGHYSTEGNLENEMFQWGLMIDGNYCFELFGDGVIDGRKGVDLYHTIRHGFPSDYESMIVGPVHIPGDGYTLSIPLSEIQDPDIHDTLRKHFPNSMSESPKISLEKATELLSSERVSKRMIREHIAERLGGQSGVFPPIMEYNGRPTYFGFLGVGFTPEKGLELVNGDDSFLSLYDTLIKNQPRNAAYMDLVDPMITFFLSEAIRQEGLSSMDDDSKWGLYLRAEELQKEALKGLREGLK